jgi:hypothetical protein
MTRSSEGSSGLSATAVMANALAARCVAYSVRLVQVEVRNPKPNRWKMCPGMLNDWGLAEKAYFT